MFLNVVIVDKLLFFDCVGLLVVLIKNIYTIVNSKENVSLNYFVKDIVIVIIVVIVNSIDCFNFKLLSNVVNSCVTSPYCISPSPVYNFDLEPLTFSSFFLIFGLSFNILSNS